MSNNPVELTAHSVRFLFVPLHLFLTNSASCM